MSDLTIEVACGVVTAILIVLIVFAVVLDLRGDGERVPRQWPRILVGCSALHSWRAGSTPPGGRRGTPTWHGPQHGRWACRSRRLASWPWSAPAWQRGRWPSRPCPSRPSALPSSSTLLPRSWLQGCSARRSQGSRGTSGAMGWSRRTPDLGIGKTVLRRPQGAQHSEGPTVLPGAPCSSRPRLHALGPL
jgi:hypothetical protein